MPAADACAARRLLTRGTAPDGCLPSAPDLSRRPRPGPRQITEIIRKAGATGVTRSELTRASKWLKARDRDDILLTLVESGDVFTVQQETGGRNAMRLGTLR